MSGAKILVADDERAILKLMQIALKGHGYEVLEASSGEEALVVASTKRPDLAVIDWGLPDMEGIEVLRRLREWSNMPVIMLTVRDAEGDKIAALDAGADDYVVKPFGMGELLARIRVALRHAARVQDEPIIEAAGLTIHLAERRVELNGETVKLTPIEYDLLKALAQHAGKVVTHRQLLRQVWGDVDPDNAAHYLRVYIGHLRKKLEDDPSRPWRIVTEPGVGYRLAIEPPET
ncbi:response regulator [Alicyclobacillus mali]|uniref:Response regulator n=1 Tax=Alicyclobacillus mali (ex Roth et al. 2021) TaxID=1123961 RepID=A0ABS0EZQ8_9BACL|nr:response regulator [Alicyclobacillus mali (ex Roth et al. 2021)]MBF8376525.1 response regulator [Alicyclobacillus mali (ex Roth et al. 2021)]MCL6488499.1 response regulator [Alicyclobacillus mali (ex Roth et al. 2021)]